MSERQSSRRNDWKDFPEWQTELRDDLYEELREARTAQDEQESHGGRRFEPFPGDAREDRERRREGSNRDEPE